MQDHPDPALRPHKEDPGTPELLKLVLPKSAVNKKAILAKHREEKQQEAEDKQREKAWVNMIKQAEVFELAAQKKAEEKNIKTAAKAAAKALVKDWMAEVKNQGNKKVEVLKHCEKKKAAAAKRKPSTHHKETGYPKNIFLCNILIYIYMQYLLIIT